MTENKKGKIIPFQQSASFYLRRGAKEAVKNDCISALHRYRIAYAKDPDNAEAALAVAETLSKMQHYEESNRILYQLLAEQPDITECYYGIACNFYGLKEFRHAVENLDEYLEQDPDGYYAQDAAEFADFMEDDDAIYDATGLGSDEDYEELDACEYAKHLMDAGDLGAAALVVSRHLQKYPHSIRVMNLSALVKFCRGDRTGAISQVRELLQHAPENVQAHCNLALFLHASGDDQSAEKELAVLKAMQAESPEDMHSIAVLDLEMRHFTDAYALLTRLRQTCPYHENVLHCLGYCMFMMGDTEGARECYRSLIKMNGDDTVARYYLGQCKRGDREERSAFRRWSIPYQVPFTEAFKRLNHINKVLNAPREELMKMWEGDQRFRALIQWGLSLPDQRAKRSMVSLIFSFGDQYAERLLRDFLLRTDQPDELKHDVFTMLGQLGAAEPYYAYLNGDWIKARVSIFALPGKLPAAYQHMLQLLLAMSVGQVEEECMRTAMRIFSDYTERNNGKLPRLSDMQSTAVAAALEYLGCQASAEPPDKSDICRKYRITETRLNNAICRLTGEEE